MQGILIKCTSWPTEMMTFFPSSTIISWEKSFGKIYISLFPLNQTLTKKTVFPVFSFHSAFITAMNLTFTSSDSPCKYSGGHQSHILTYRYGLRRGKMSQELDSSAAYVATSQFMHTFRFPRSMEPFSPTWVAGDPIGPCIWTSSHRLLGSPAHLAEVPQSSANHDGCWVIRNRILSSDFDVSSSSPIFLIVIFCKFLC